MINSVHFIILSIKFYPNEYSWRSIRVLVVHSLIRVYSWKSTKPGGNIDKVDKKHVDRNLKIPGRNSLIMAYEIHDNNSRSNVYKLGALQDSMPEVREEVRDKDVAIGRNCEREAEAAAIWGLLTRFARISRLQARR